MMNITIRQINAFLQVAALGSFTRAAEQLHTMQPALSQQVRDLEAELGIRLFDRTTRRVELTEAGAEFRAIAAKAIEELDVAARNAQGLAERKRGRVIVAAPPLLAAAVVPKAIVDFQEKYPGITVRLIDARSDQIVELVRSGQVDCGVGTFHAGEEGITPTVLARDNLMVFCAPNHPLAKRKSVHWKELEGQPLVTLTRDSGIRILVEVGFEAAHIKLVPAYEVTWITTALALVEAGLGIGVFPTYAWAGAQSLDISGSPLEPAIARDITLITRSGREVAPATQAFVRFLRKSTSGSRPDRQTAKVPRRAKGSGLNR